MEQEDRPLRPTYSALPAIYAGRRPTMGTRAPKPLLVTIECNEMKKIRSSLERGVSNRKAVVADGARRDSAVPAATLSAACPDGAGAAVDSAGEAHTIRGRGGRCRMALPACQPNSIDVLLGHKILMGDSCEFLLSNPRDINYRRGQRTRRVRCLSPGNDIDGIHNAI